MGMPRGSVEANQRIGVADVIAEDQSAGIVEDDVESVHVDANGIEASPSRHRGEFVKTITHEDAR